MGIPRSRTRLLPGPKGSAVRNGIWIGGGEHNVYYSAVDDLTGPGDNAPFSLEKWSFSGGLLNRLSGGNGSKFYDYQCDITDVPANFPHLSVSGTKTNVQAATEAVARSNPSRPYVDVPVALLELGDVTQLIRDSGRSLIRRAAGANIKYQFGIAPLASDIAKLLRFHEQVDRRVRQIERLSGPRGFRRTMEIDAGSNTGTAIKSFQSVYASVSNVCYAETAVAVRAHTRWRAASGMSQYRSPASMRALARRALLGLTVDFSTLWEAMPWSWLIDWGSNIGTYLKANRNIVPATLTEVSVMRHTRTNWWTYSWGPSNGLSMTPFQFTRESKVRVLSHASPTAHLPFLSGRQVGILASLAVLRR